MMKLNINMLIVSVVLLILPMNTLANEVHYEDNDTPISFMIEVLPWDIANQILPNGTTFTVIDVETGLQFRVQRRAGNKHADVQPLTKKDTQIMKKIYNGRWSWDRRSIIALVDDQMIAASMHGMPHGAGAIKNGFPGHFCIHFWGSTTHRSGNMDLAHKLMILKAGGKIDDYLNNIDPYELIHIFSIAVNNRDKQLLELTVAKNENQSQLTKIIKDLTYFRITNMSLLPMEDINEPILIEVPVEVEFYKSNKGRDKKVMHFIIRRDSLIDRWYIDEQYFLKEL
ncbi:hypothetical protein [Bacillus alveayuensis]|uniref:hypothetical protein n=1 Tax=Aeribacillus alveayuensis TaxID=279215 RepID=UPI000AE80C70|nr:hypothetical protein [Bacillus alveayuensis]